MEELRWNRHTFHIPVAVSSNASVAAKHHFLTACVQTIGGASASNETKLNAFTSRFAIGSSVLREVASKCRKLLDPKHPVPVFTKEKIFKFTDGRF